MHAKSWPCGIMAIANCLAMEGKQVYTSASPASSANKVPCSRRQPLSINRMCPAGQLRLHRQLQASPLLHPPGPQAPLVPSKASQWTVRSDCCAPCWLDSLLRASPCSVLCTVSACNTFLVQVVWVGAFALSHSLVPLPGNIRQGFVTSLLVSLHMSGQRVYSCASPISPANEVPCACRQSTRQMCSHRQLWLHPGLQA